MANRLVLNKAEVIATPMRLVKPLVQRTAEKIYADSLKRASSGPYAGSGPKPRLASTIRLTYRETTYQFHAKIGSRSRKASAVHQGAVRHPIRGRGKNLRFYWRKVGAFVAFKAVDHPGMSGKQYLVIPLRRYGRRAGFRVVYVPKIR